MKIKTAQAWGAIDRDGKPYPIANGLRDQVCNVFVRIVKESDWQRIQKALELLEKEEGK